LAVLPASRGIECQKEAFFSASVKKTRWSSFMKVPTEVVPYKDIHEEKESRREKE